MKWLLTLLLWGLAVVVALGVLWRLWRGKTVVLRGRWTPRFVRMVAVTLVFLGIGTGQNDAAPVKQTEGKKGKVDDQLPPHITKDVVAKWLAPQARTGEWMRFKQTWTLLMQRAEPGLETVERALQLSQALPERLRVLLREDLRAMAGGPSPAAANPRDLALALEEAERGGYIDPWLCAYVWRKAAVLTDGSERKAIVDLMAKLHRHARLANALIAAGARLRPLMLRPQPWGTKSGRPPAWAQQQQLFAPGAGLAVDLLPALRSQFATADAGTWDSQGLTIFAVAQDSAAATMIRVGQAGVPQTSGMVRFGRLDLLETTPGDRPVLLTHRVFGTLTLPPGKLISVWDLPQYLSAKGKEQLKKTVADALDGKDAASRLLEQHLPLAAPFVRAGIHASPKAAGAPALRLILTQFDDVPPAPPIAAASPEGPLTPPFRR